jgi:hypothetical protein
MKGLKHQNKTALGPFHDAVERLARLRHGRADGPSLWSFHLRRGDESKETVSATKNEKSTTKDKRELEGLAHVQWVRGLLLLGLGGGVRSSLLLEGLGWFSRLLAGAFRRLWVHTARAQPQNLERTVAQLGEGEIIQGLTMADAPP